MKYSYSAGLQHSPQKSIRGIDQYLRFADTRRRNKELGLEEDHSRLGVHAQTSNPLMVADAVLIV
jgi:hypothetical protein